MKGRFTILASIGALILFAVYAGDGAAKRASNSNANSSKLILVVTGFSCNTVDFTVKLCEGWNAAAKKLPAGFTFQHKAGTDFTDQTALNNLIQTGLELQPAGVIVFSGGPAAQVPVLTKACQQGAKVFILDSNMPTLHCKSELLETNNYEAGVNAAKWLLKHPPKSKEVGIVGFPPGQFNSNDSRNKGFRAGLAGSGYKVVATVTTSGDIQKTRDAVTNMLTAHPNIGAILSLTDFHGDGTTQAMISDHRLDITHLTIDGNMEAVKKIPNKGVTADTAQNPYMEGYLAVMNMVKLLQGKTVAVHVYIPTKVIDAANAGKYIAAGGKY
jgi:ribose transport system substrate-binding protein